MINNSQTLKSLLTKNPVVLEFPSPSDVSSFTAKDGRVFYKQRGYFHVAGSSMPYPDFFSYFLGEDKDQFFPAGFYSIDFSKCLKTDQYGALRFNLYLDESNFLSSFDDK